MPGGQRTHAQCKGAASPAPAPAPRAVGADAAPRPQPLTDVPGPRTSWPHATRSLAVASSRAWKRGPLQEPTGLVDLTAAKGQPSVSPAPTSPQVPS